MKILYLHQYFKTNNESGGTRSYEFAKHLVNEGHEVIIITGENINKENIDGIKVLSTKTKYHNKMSKFKRIKAFGDYIIKSIFIGLKTNNIDCIFATSTPLTIGISAIALKKIKKCKMIFEVRDVWPDVPIELGIIKNKLIIKSLKKLEQMCYKNSYHIITLSDGMEKNLVSKKIDEKKITTIPNIANLDLYKNSINKEEIKKRLGLENKFICIHPGTMGMVNGLDYILDLAKETEDKEIVYLLIGEGKEKERLKLRKKEEKIENILILNALPKKEIVELIKAADIGIMCVADFNILKDNSANKFFDFLAAGLPICINYEGWQKEVLEKERNGASFNYIQLDEMKNFIESIKLNKNQYKKFSENSKKLANEYSLEKACEKLNKILIKGDLK